MVIEAQAVVYMLKYSTLTRLADIGFYFVPTSKCLCNITADVFSIYYDSAGPKVCQLVLSFLRSTIIHKFSKDLTNFTKIYTLCHVDSFNMSDLMMLDMNQHQLW